MEKLFSCKQMLPFKQKQGWLRRWNQEPREQELYPRAIENQSSVFSLIKELLICAPLDLKIDMKLNSVGYGGPVTVPTFCTSCVAGGNLSL